ncbi:hypothetical protein TH9_12330 [Thalassospira xiamenensis]|uniref:hypothetical protein n=1 Tax=Thalassospira xiamenensis TaxID=220697 RepID=UPI000DEDEEE7|nr:hypothetical protein [Thalassospira xiamenensis]RCK32508.1 hypothetical protein TH9_12330 [Thalassospira xiamenensis]
MTAPVKKNLPLAPASAPVPVQSFVSDAFPSVTTSLAAIRQQTGFGRQRRFAPVSVEAKRSHRINEIDAVEKAFFPRFFWGVFSGFEDQDDPENVAVLKAMRDDINCYAALMMPAQQFDYERELNNAAYAAMEPLIDLTIGERGGWDGIEVLMTGFLLVIWVDRHAAQAMFTTDFERVAQGILMHLDQLYGRDCDDAMPAARQKLPKVIARLKACGLFKWLPDYRSDDQ